MKRVKRVLPETDQPEEKVISVVKKIEKSDNISADQMVKAVKPYCPEDLVSIRTELGALSRPFCIGGYNAPHKRHLQIRGYVDFYGGYAEHTREVLRGLDETGQFALRLAPIPSPRDIDPVLANKMDWYTTNPSFRKEGSTFMTIAGPGHMQQSKISQDGRHKIGWTMIETLGVQPEIVEWLNNMDEIYAPTFVDKARFEQAGVKNVSWMPLGYDPSKWNVLTNPMDISTVRNRYVFGVLGSWNVRKSVKEIVQAYATEFSSKDPVSLMLVCKYGTRKWGDDKEDEERWCIKWELEKYLKEIGRKEELIPHITILDVPLHPQVIPTVTARFNSLVGFSKGESTWLPGLEVGAQGKPIIQLASKCSGFMDYLYGNPYMCQEVRMIEADAELYEGTSEYYKGQKLAHGNIEELRGMMRMVYMENGTKEQAEITGKLLGKISKYPWKRTINLLKDRL